MISCPRVRHVVVINRFLLRDVRIFLCRAEACVAQTFGKLADLHAVLHTVSRERVTQAVRSHLGVDTWDLQAKLKDSLNAPSGDFLAGLIREC